MFSRIQWRIAAGYVALIAVVLVGLGVYLAAGPEPRAAGTGPGAQVASAIAVALAVAAVLATALAIILARVTTEPIRRLTEAARRLAAGELDAPIPMQGRDEVSVLARALHEMATRLHGHIRAVEDERSRLAAVLSHMADGLVMMDDAGLVRLINPAAERLLQTTAAQAEGQSAMAVLRDHELAALADNVIRRAAPTSELRLVELGPTAQRRVVQALASRIPGGEGSHGRVLLILQDVTELRRAETVRREFVSNVSHELRTPVASLKALVETLQDGALDDAEVAREFIGRMHVEVEGLAQLVEELLELSRVESGQLPLRLQSVDLGAVAVAAAERLRPQAQRQGVLLEIAQPGALPTVRADPERVHQVVVNLVHNAVKFTPPGGRITIRAEEREGDVAVTIADNGVGIAADALPRVFERFYKADQARAGGGTGLGLAIAKHLVQAHGGRIWAESEGEGKGATFTFALPISRDR